MLTELLSYDPADIDPALREKMAGILKDRAELLRAQAEVSDLRSRAWAGEEGLSDIIELKAADLTKLREDYMSQVRVLVKDSVDVEGLLGVLPMMGLAVLQKFKVPPTLLLEAMGVDFDHFKKLVDEVKEMLK